MDKVDQQILELLQQNAKLNYKELAAKLNMSKTPIYERIKRLERDGIIQDYVAVLDRKKLPSSMIVFCHVELSEQRLDIIEQFEKDISGLSEVMECYLMGGASDFLMKVVVKDLEAYHQFSAGKLATLPNVSQIKSLFVLDEVKRSMVLPVRG